MLASLAREAELTTEAQKASTVGVGRWRRVHATSPPCARPYGQGPALRPGGEGRGAAVAGSRGALVVRSGTGAACPARHPCRATAFSPAPLPALSAARPGRGYPRWGQGTTGVGESLRL